MENFIQENKTEIENTFNQIYKTKAQILYVELTLERITLKINIYPKEMIFEKVNLEEFKKYCFLLMKKRINHFQKIKVIDNSDIYFSVSHIYFDHGYGVLIDTTNYKIYKIESFIDNYQIYNLKFSKAEKKYIFGEIGCLHTQSAEDVKRACKKCHDMIS